MELATLPIAENHDEVTSEQAAPVVGAASQQPPAAPPEEKFDEYGRTEAERTVVLGSKNAELINLEVEVGKHDSYDEALAYVIARGFAEIERTRESQRKTAATKKLAAETTLVTNMFAMNPKLVCDQDFVTKMMNQLAELSAQAKGRKR